MQVYLVTGGYRPGVDSFLDSTELFLPSATSWIYSAALPSPQVTNLPTISLGLPSGRVYLRAATLNNKVLITGTNIDTLIIMRQNLYKYY